MRAHAAALRRETESHGQFEGIEQAHLVIEPLFRVGPIEIRPAKAGPQFPYSQFP